MRDRNNSLDCLRVLACFFVILLHVSAGYVIENIDIYNFQFTIGNFYNSISRISVPIFIMLSGAFLLENNENINIKFFYRKSFFKIGVPTIVWSLIYVIYRYIIEIGAEIILKKPFDYYLPLKNWILGEPFYHLWYLYMVIGLYAITPVLIRLKKKVKNIMFSRLSIFFLILGIFINKYISLIWIQFILYIGYFMIGFSLKSYFKEKKFDIKFSITISIFSSLIIFSITEYFAKYNLFNRTLYFYENLSPFVIISSIFTFVTFLNLKIKNKIFEHLGAHSFNIYLMHAGIISVLRIILINLLKLSFNGIWYIPVFSIIVFFFAYHCSLIVVRAQKFFLSKNTIKNPNISIKKYSSKL